MLFTLDNTLPDTGSIFSPLNGLNLSGSITINATATDAGSGISSVEFWNGTPGVGNIIGWENGTDTFYETSWNTAAESGGTRSLYVRVYDNAGNIYDNLTAVVVTVDNTPPDVGIITVPVHNANVSGTIMINATASDALTGVQRVEFYVDGWNPGDLIDIDYWNAYSVLWNTDFKNFL